MPVELLSVIERFEFPTDVIGWKFWCNDQCQLKDSLIYVCVCGWVQMFFFRGERCQSTYMIMFQVFLVVSVTVRNRRFIFLGISPGKSLSVFVIQMKGTSWTPGT